MVALPWEAAVRQGVQRDVVRVTYRYIRPLTVVYARSMGPYETSSREAWRPMNAWLERASMPARARSRATATSATIRS